MIQVDIGCGAYKRPGWIGLDLVELEGVDYVVDVRNGIPFTDAQVDEIYCSHVLEHLTSAEGLKLLKECNRVLKDTGTIEIMVPDFVYALKTFLEAPDDKKWGWPLNMIFGMQTHSGELHKTGFTDDRLRAILGEAGFNVQALVPVWSHDQKCLVAKAMKNA